MLEYLCGETVLDTLGRPYQLRRIAGQGGQGVVFEEQSGQYMVKVLTHNEPERLQELQRRYRWLLQRDLHAQAQVVVPEALLAFPRVGYVMRRVSGHQPLTVLLRPPPNASLGDWYNTQTGGIRWRLLIGAAIARTFGYLHNDGLSYCDLSDTNILVAKDMQRPSVCVIDPDNISVSGKGESLVLGTARYMAPEIVRGSHQPDSYTDSHSLAVILFQLLRLNHPLLGDAVDAGPFEEEEAALRGERPYVDHPTDPSNRSGTVLPGAAVCSRPLLRLFERTFTTGLQRRWTRPHPEDWEEECLAAADNTSYCKHCGAGFFPRASTEQKQVTVCPWCNHSQRIPPLLLIAEATCVEGKQHVGKPIASLVLQAGQTPIRMRHAARGYVGVEGDKVVARLQYGPTGVQLETLGVIPISLAAPGRASVRLVPGQPRSVPPDSTIHFGEVQAELLTRLAQLRGIEGRAS
jgi:DNA-binding helix-hairpin-helix protein with protein kinase domain